MSSLRISRAILFICTVARVWQAPMECAHLLCEYYRHPLTYQPISSAAMASPQLTEHSRFSLAVVVGWRPVIGRYRAGQNGGRADWFTRAISLVIVAGWRPVIGRRCTGPILWCADWFSWRDEEFFILRATLNLQDYAGEQRLWLCQNLI